MFSLQVAMFILFLFFVLFFVAFTPVLVKGEHFTFCSLFVCSLFSVPHGHKTAFLYGSISCVYPGIGLKKLSRVRARKKSQKALASALALCLAAIFRCFFFLLFNCI
jgi:hypothetical protein